MQGILTKITIKSEKKFLPAALAFLKEIAQNIGFDETTANKLMIITEEACLNVIQHAFIDKSEEYFDIIIEKRAGDFVIAIEDKGLPYDFTSEPSEKSKGLGLTLMEKLSDEIKFINLGAGGKRIELIKHLSEHILEKSFSDDGIDKKDDSLEDTSNIPLEIRLMKPEEGVKLERLMFKVYGYTYPEFVYFPEIVKDLVQKELLVSTVAVTPEGEFAGHQGLRKKNEDSKIAEIAMGVVDPRFRGRGLFEKLKDYAFEYIKSKGILGLYGEAVTIHSYSQKANYAMGGKPTGILLGYVSVDLTFKKINEQQTTRQTAVLFYTRLNNELERDVYLPTEHENIILKIYENAGFKRIPKRETVWDSTMLKEKSVIDISIFQGFKIANIDLIEFGKDVIAAIRGSLKNLCLQKMEIIHLDLPLNNKATQYYCGEFEKMGFYFSGILPESRDGDILRLQYLNNVIIDPAKTAIVGDFTKELFDYVLSFYNQI